VHRASLAYRPSQFVTRPIVIPDSPRLQLLSQPRGTCGGITETNSCNRLQPAYLEPGWPLTR
jgi:hypothetical protein